MDNEPIVKYLDMVVTPEHKLVLVEAMRSLTRLGLQDHAFFLNEILESQEEENDVVIARIDDLLQNAIHDSLRNFGIEIDPTTPLKLRTDILNGVLSLDDWSDPEAIQQLCDADDEADGILASLLELVTQTSHAEYALYLRRVSPNLIERIDDVHQRYLPDAMPSMEEHNRAKMRTERFLAQQTSPILSQALADMLLFGGDYHALLEPYAESIAALDQKEAVQELVGFALVSELADDKLQAAIEKESQGWWEGTSMTQAVNQITTVLKGVLA